MSLKSFVSFLLLGFAPLLSAHAQYYYQDICNAQKTMQEHRQYREKGIRHIRIRSYDADHSPNKGFRCVKKISDDFLQVKTETASFQTGNSTIISMFDDSGRIVHTIDSTALSINDTYYYYDGHDLRRIDSIRFYSYSVNGTDTFRFHEAHAYKYDDSGRLRKMLRSKNDKLYSVITFSTDSLGRVISERERGKYDTVPTEYYKYDDRGNMTDIYHYNPLRQKLEPDYLFDYDNHGRLAEKTTVTMNTNNYLLWKYFYDERGLVSREECYGKKHALLGELDFEYE
jgi:YD repeat-containing protein